MVAIVSGNSLGLEQSSLAALGANGLIGTATQGRNGESAYVNVASGNLVLQDADSFLVGIGPSVASLRTYNSQGLANFSNNDGWLNGQYKSLVSLGGGVLQRTDGDGSTSTYLWNATQNLFVETSAAGAALSTVQSNANGTYTWTNGATGATETYQGSGAGLIQSSTDTSGNSLTYTYAGSLLTQVTDADGESVIYAYSGNNLIGISTSLASGQVLNEVSYTYDSLNRLSTVSVNLDPSGVLPTGSESSSTYVTTYSYDGSSDRVTGVAQSDGTSLAFTYVLAGGAYRIASFTDGDGNTTTFAYDTVADTTTVTDPMGVSSLYRYDASGQLTELRNGVTATNVLGLSQLSYAYNALGDVTSTTDGLGRSVTMTYDSNGNLTSRVDGAGDTQTYTYNAANQALTNTVYATAATVSGSSTTAASVPETTRYVYAVANPTQLRFAISAEGNVTEYRYDARGQLTSTLHYPAATYATGTLAPGGVPAEADMQAWSAAQDANTIQREDFTYDFRGQLQSSTTYGSTDASGNGIAGTTTQYVYDQRGELLQTVSPDGTGIAQSIYDGLGRVVSSTTKSADGSLAVTTITQYDDAQGKTVVTLANGLSTTSAYDSAGRLVSVTPFDAGSTDLGTTRYAYDADGRLLMTTDPTGARTWMIYDAAGRKVADVDGTGGLTEYVYDRDDRVSETIAYATGVDTSGLVDAAGNPLPVTLAALRPAASAGDEKSWNFYDAAGRLAWQVDAQGFVTQTRYDGASRVVSTTQLATPIDTSALGDGTGLLVSPDGSTLVSNAMGATTPVSESTTTLLVSPASGAAGTPVLLTAMVSGALDPSGSVTFFDGGTALGSAALIDGVATYTLDSLSIGTHDLSAAYSGDAFTPASTSPDVVETVQTTSALSLATLPITDTLGSQLAIIATITGSSPSGMVSFFDGGNLVGSALVADGQATLSLDTLPLGSNALQAVYSGDAANTSSSASFTEVVSAAPTGTSLTVSRTGAGYGSPRVLSATVTSAAPGAPQPSGAVTFYSGATALGTAELDGGVASLTVADLPVGTDALTAVYSGSTSSQASTSVVVDEAVVPALSSTLLTVSASSGGAYPPVILSAQVSGVGPTGTVTFLNGTTVVATATLVNGIASVVVANLPAGKDTLVATYSGDTDNATSVSAQQQIVIPPQPILPATVKLLSSGASAVSGDPLVFTAEVTGNGVGASTPPTGIADFYSGSTLIGRARLADGWGAITVTNLATGTDSITVRYEGDANNAPATSATLLETITPAPATVTLVAPATVVQGASLTLVATIRGDRPLTGLVTFFDGEVSLGTATVIGAKATLTTTLLTIGKATLTATYSGDSDTATGVSDPVSVTVTPSPKPLPPPPHLPPTFTTLSASKVSAGYGTAITFTARVGGLTSASLPSGTVSFFDGNTLLGSAVLTSGQASLVLADLPLGRNAITAVYSGDIKNATSASPALPETIVPATTAVTLAPITSVPRGTGHASATLVAQVSGALPTGTVIFYDRNTLLGSASIEDGLAELSSAILPSGTAEISARYVGDADNAPSTSAITAYTPQVLPTIDLAATARPPLGTAVTLQATLDGGPPPPSGTVSFFSDGVLLGSATLDASDTAALVVDGMALGTHAVTAVYSGDAFYLSTASATRTVTVVAAKTTTTLTAPRSTTTAGVPLTLTAAIASTASGAQGPTGTVTFYKGKTAIGTAAVIDGQANITVSNLPIGNDRLRAIYSGDGNNAASTSKTVIEKVQAGLVSTATVLATSSAEIVQGSPLTLTATVSGPGGPTGTVTFYNAGTDLGSATLAGGQASLSVSDLPAGSDALTAVYGGDASNSASTSAAVNETVDGPPALLSIVSAGSIPRNGDLEIEVAGNSPGGTVSVFDGTMLLGSAAVVDGIATLAAAVLPLGSGSFNAAYSGDISNGASAIAFTQTVTPAPSVTTLSASSERALSGAPVILTARVSGSSPSGTVTFYDGSTVLGTATLGNGVAALTVADLPTGLDALTAVYSGDSDNLGSTSWAVAETVTQPVSVAATTGSADRTVTRIYDEDGLLRASIDGEGYLTQYIYDAAGELVQTLAYANAVPGFTTAQSIANLVAAARSSDSLAGLLPAASPADISTFNFYNARGQLVGQVDGGGYLTETVYDSNGRISQVVRYANPVNGPVTARSTLAELRPASSAQDQVSANTWDALGRLATQTNDEGTVTSYGYNSVGQVIQTTVALNTSDQRTVMSRYDVQGRLVEELSGNGAALITGNQTQSQIDAIWSQYGTSYTYDAAGRRTSATDANGNRTLYFYDTAGRLTDTVNALGEVSETRYNALGQVTDRIDYGTRIDLSGLTGSNAGGLVNGALTSALAAVRDASLDEDTGYAYDDRGLLASTTDALQNATTFAHDAFGDMVAETYTGDDGKPIVDTASFDRRGLQTASVQDSAGLDVASGTVYDAFGRVVQTTDGNGNVSQQSYDTLGRVVQTIDPTNATRSTTYDAFGRILTQTDALGQTTTYAYDTADRSVTVTTPEGISTTSVHNREGQTLSVTDGLGNTTSYVYDSDGNLIETDAPPAAGSSSATTTRSTFDAADRLITTTDANQNLVSYSYDAANRLLTRTVDPNGFHIVTTYGYDALGRQVSVTDANGNTTTTDFDLDNNAITIHRPGGWPTIPTVYTYDAKGRVLTVETQGWETDYTYDALGRLVKQVKDPGPRIYGSLDIELDYSYDKNGNLISSTDGDGNLTRYVYDADNRQTYTIDALGDTSRTLYDADGRITSTTTFVTPIAASALASLPVAATAAEIEPLLTSSTSDVSEIRRYDNDGRLRYTVAGDGSVVEYTYDANGNVTDRRAYATKLSSSFMASWDGTSDPSPVADDAHDQQVRTVYDALNRAIYTIDGTGGVTAMSYDGNGNVIDKIAYATTIDPATAATAAAIGQAIQTLAPNASNAELRSYYDNANRMSYSVDGTGAVTQYSYDGMNHVTREVQYATPIAVGSPPFGITSSEADRVTEWVYDLSGRVAFKLQRVSTAGASVGMSKVTSYLYDTVGNLARVRETTALIPDTMSRNYQALCASVPVNAATDPTTYYGYDNAGRLSITIGPDGLATLYKYDAASNLISTTQEANRVDTSSFDTSPFFNALHATYTWTFASILQGFFTVPSADDRTTINAYDNAGREVYSVDPLGYATGTTYDGAGRVLSTTLYANQAGNVYAGVTPGQIQITADTSKDQTTRYAYDAEGHLLSSTDALGGTESYTYDGVGNQTSYTNKLGNTWTYDYDADGRMTLEAAPVADFYDGANLLDSITTQLTYDALGNLTSRTEAANTYEARTTHYVYDALGRLTKTIYPPVGVYDPSSDDLNASLDSVDDASSLRSEQSETLSTQVIYDVFGDAVANIDTAGNISTTAYDGMGRALYDVNALGYVTGYQYDAFGDETAVTRYANATNVNATVTASGGNIPDAATIASAIVASAADRTTTTQYDRMGRAVQVTQPSVWVDNGDGQGYQASPVTRTSYDAFGEVIQVSVLDDLPSDTWATSTYYYDLRGDQVASIDALGYLTTQSFDAAGNLLSETQYANAASGVTTGGYTPPGASASDRTTTYTYDQNNRKTSQTQVGVVYSTASDGSATTGDLTTTYAYDALGNLTRTTDALGNSTTLYYDSLSRVVAIVAPARNSTVDGTSLTPVTTFTRDVFGNVTEQTEFAPGYFSIDSAGDISVGWAGNTPPTERVTQTSYNSFDRALETDEYSVDSSGAHLDTEVQHFMSYDAQGRLAKTWQGVAGNDGQAQTLYTVYQYDALGRQTAIITPASDSVLDASGIDTESQEAAGSVTTGMVWDAFGDMTQRGTYATGTLAQYQEDFEYDNAGNLWRTNSGDGKVEIALYDLQGFQTAQLTSAGTLDLGTLGDAEAADDLGNNGVRRTDSARDLLGRVVEQTLPSRQDGGDAQAYRPVIYQTFDRWGNMTSQSDARNAAWVTQYAYNADDEVIQETQPDASGAISSASPVTQMYYDALGREVATRDADGDVNGQTWDAAGQLVSEIHADGGVVTHSYDGFGDQVRVIDADGNETDYGYDFLGRQTSSTQVGVGVYGMSGNGAITGGSSDLTTDYTYDQAGRLISQVSDSGALTNYTYDLRGNVIETDNADGLVSKATFDPEGHQTAEQDGDGNISTWQYYDIFGLLKTYTAIGGAQEQFAYDNARELVSQTDAMGDTVASTYDAAGQRVEQVDDPDGLDLQQGDSYDAAGELSSSTDGDGNVTRYVYDSDNRLTYTIDAAGDTTRTLYDAAGRVSSTTTFATPIAAAALAALPAAATVAQVAALLVTSSSDVTDFRRYDAQGRLHFTVAGDGSVVEYSYDANGNVIDRRAYATKLSSSFMASWDGSTDPSPVPDDAHDERLQTVYDALNRAIYTMDGTGAVTAMAYDGNGNVVDRISYATAIDPSTAATATAIGQAVQALAPDACNQEVRSIYDAASRLTLTVDGTGAVTEYSYDGAGNMTRKVEFATAVAAGTDPRSVTASEADRVTEWVYDQSERVAFELQRVSTTGASVGMSQATSYLYDSDGRLARVRAAAALVADTQSRDYASLLADVPVTPSADRTTYYGYDNAGRLSIQIAADGAATLYRYDGAGHLTATTAQATPVDTSSFDTSPLFTQEQPGYSWATASVLLGFTTATANDRTTISAYDAAGRKTYSIDALGYATQTTYDGAGRVLSTTLYASEAGNAYPGVTPGQIQITADASADQTNTFTYDAAGHLLSTTDGLGNTESYTYDGVGNQLTFTNKKGVTWSYGYDAAGRETLETDPAADSNSLQVATQLSYDAVGNLTSRTEAANTAQARTTSYAYDALGRQIKTTYPPVGVYNPAGDDLNAALSSPGDAGAIRSENTETLSTQVLYDVFGDAVANIDTAGNVSTKAYDGLGRVVYDVDALGYVTHYGLDAFGDVTTLTRYANATNVNAEVTAAGSNIPNAATIANAIVASDGDRSIQTQYDAMGRAVQVTQPSVWVDNGDGEGYTAAAVTRTSYNAFGQILQSSVLDDLPSDTWATKTYYYDLRGDEVACIDALGYLTTQSFDAAGNLTATTEYANAASGVTTSGYTPPNTGANDRTTTYTYDQNNRKTSQTQVGVVYSTASDGSTTTGNVTTTYGYDALGNLTRTTDALGNSTYTYYDALGRTTAVASPARNSTVDGSTLIPLTEFQRDAYGNVTSEIEVGAGVLSANETGFSVNESVAASNERVTNTTYDLLGHAIEVDDADGVAHYMSYDAQGHLAKSWQGVSGNDGEAQTLYTVFQYDALGQQTAIITPASNSVLGATGITTESQEAAGSSTVGMVWNGFGEMTQRGTYATGSSPVYQECFEYDNAGRLWLTNSGDGNVKVALYNLQGLQTAQLTSAGSLDLSSYADGDPNAEAQTLDDLGSAGVHRTDSQHDLLGRVTVQTLPSRQDSSDAQAYRPVVLQTYDRWGNVLSQSDVRDTAWLTTYVYNANNQVIQQTQPDSNGNISSASPVTRIFYDALGRQVAIIDADGNLNGQTWDAAGQLATEIHADHDATGGIVTHSYDAFGDQVRLIDADNDETDYGYDQLGRNTSVTNVDVGIYSVTGSNTVTGGLGNLTTLYTYDQAGRKLSEQDASGATTLYTYDLAGNVIATDGPDGLVSKATFNAQGKQTAEQDADGNTSTWSYDSFGQLQTHTDIGGDAYQYAYDNARQLVSQVQTTSPLGQYQNLAYAYDAAGQLVQITDNALGQITTYAYNAAGQHVLEETVQGTTTVQDQTLGYDKLGRLEVVDDTLDGIELTMDYDQVGNKTYEKAVYGGANPTVQQLWFAYDSMNRQTLADGAVDGNAQNMANITPSQGHILAYDHNGNRISDSSWGVQVTPQYVQNYDESSNTLGDPVLTGYQSQTGVQTQWYSYDHMNRLQTVATGGYGYVQTGVDSQGHAVYQYEALGQAQAIVLDTRYYNAASRVVQSGPNGSLDPNYVKALVGSNTNLSGATTTTTQYDAAGRVLSQHVVNEADASGDYDISYQTPTGTAGSGYDAAGNVDAYRMTQGDITTDYTITPQLGEGYLQRTIAAESVNNSSGNTTSGTTTDSYDANGYLTSVNDSAQSANDRTLINDAYGHVLQKTQQGNVLKEIVVNGTVIGTFGVGVDPNNPTSNGNPNYVMQADFDLAYQPVTNSYPAATTGQYPVQSGDTLQSIAQAAYGDSSLWYQIAEANGLSGNQDLRVGQIINIPTRVGDAHNNASTYAPYDASRIVGNTSPQLPTPAGNSDSGGGCGGLGELLVIAVAVAVSSLVGPEVLGAIAPGGVAADASLGEVIAAGAVAGAAGSVASQVVGNIVGVQNGFSWSGVALGALGGAVSAGLGGIPTGDGSSVGGVLPGNGVDVSIARAAIGSALTQGIGVAVGLQKNFSWTGVAASAVGAGVGAQVGQGLESTGAFASALGNGQLPRAIVSSFAAGLATSVLQGGRVNVVQVATDAFGNALGGALADAAAGPPNQSQAETNRLNAYDQAAAQANTQAQQEAFRASEITQQNDDAVQEVNAGYYVDNRPPTTTPAAAELSNLLVGMFGAANPAPLGTSGDVVLASADNAGPNVPMPASATGVGMRVYPDHAETYYTFDTPAQSSASTASASAGAGGAGAGAGEISSSTLYAQGLGDIRGTVTPIAQPNTSPSDFAVMDTVNESTQSTPPAPVAVSQPAPEPAGPTLVPTDNGPSNPNGGEPPVAASPAPTRPGTAVPPWHGFGAGTGLPAPIASTSYTQARSALADARASDQAYYNNLVNNAESSGVAVFGSIARPLNKAFYDVAQGALGLYGFVTDSNARTNALGAVVQAGDAVANALVHPIDSAQAAYNAATSYASGKSVQEIAEDAVEFAAGGLATAGTGKVVGAIGNAALDSVQTIAAKATRFATGGTLGGAPIEAGYAAVPTIAPSTVNATGLVAVNGTAAEVLPAAAVRNAAGDAEAAAGNAEGNAAHSAYQYELLKRDLLRQEIASPGESMSGPVVLKDPVAGATPAQVQQIRQYADIGNLSIDEGYMSPTGRVSTTGTLRSEASAAAREEGAAAEAEGQPYTGVVGHGPDTTWTGNPVSPFWLDMDSSINSSLGRQAQNYPLGYKPTRFIYQGDLDWTGNGNW